MSEDTQVLDQPSGSAPTSGSVAVSPVGSSNKEAPVSMVELPELRPAGPEVKHDISQELKKLGMEEKKDGPNLTSEHKKIGLSHAGSHVPVPTSPSGNIILPMSEEEIASKLKAGQDDDSGKWQAALMDKINKIIKWALKVR